MSRAASKTTAYLIFAKREGDKLVQESPVPIGQGLKFALVGLMWRDTPQEEKKQYEDEARNHNKQLKSE